MTYAPEHGKELLNRSHRRSMGMSGAPCCGPQQTGTTEDSHHPRDLQRYLLHIEERLRMAAIASGLPTLGDRLLVVQEVVAHRRNLRTAQRRATRAATDPLG
jgi:hypothetical protein